MRSSLFLLFISTLLLSACDGAEERNCPDTEGAKTAAWISSQRFVVRQLNDPDSADFGSYHKAENGVRWISHCKFVVTATFTAKNAFGGSMRATYFIDMEYLPDEETWKGTSLVINK